MHVHPTAKLMSKVSAPCYTDPYKEPSKLLQITAHEYSPTRTKKKKTNNVKSNLANHLIGKIEEHGHSAPIQVSIFQHLLADSHEGLTCSVCRYVGN